MFVGAVESIAESLGIAPLVLALVLAPLATELPEKAKSILWVRDSKDTLAGGAIALSVLPRRSVGLLPTLAWAAMFIAFVVYVAVG